jgi:capsular polysaccharide transport system permease protein
MKLDTFRTHPYWLVCLVAIFVYGFYQAVVATDRYVSTAHVVLNSPQMGIPDLDFGSILAGTSGSSDLLLLRDHLLSVDMLRKLNDRLDLRPHYSARKIDRLSRMASPDLPMEKFHAYYLSRVEVVFDEYSKLLRIRAQAFDRETAHAIVEMLLVEGEAHMNAMGRRLAAEQVRFIEGQVEELAHRVTASRDALLGFQNKHGLVSPRATVENLSAIVAGLEGELAKLQAQRTALATTRSEISPEMLNLRAQINALQNQIKIERARMATGSGDALNRTTVEFETLELQARFALELYSSALAVLENTRVEAARQLKQVSVLQFPTLPEYSTEPRRLYKTTVFAILALLAALIAHMLALIVRDHRD